MSRRRHWLGLLPLALLAAGAAALFAAEWRRVPAEFDAAALRAAAGPARTETMDAAPAEFEPPPLDAFVEALERPLFARERRPPEAEPAPADEAAAEAVPEAGPDPVAARLQGILTSAGSRIAILTLPGRSLPLYVMDGDEVQGWTVERIEADGLSLRQGEARQTLRLVYGGDGRAGR